MVETVFHKSFSLVVSRLKVLMIFLECRFFHARANLEISYKCCLNPLFIAHLLSSFQTTSKAWAREINLRKKCPKIFRREATKKKIDLAKTVPTIVIYRVQSTINARAQTYFHFKKLWWTIPIILHQYYTYTHTNAL